MDIVRVRGSANFGLEGNTDQTTAGELKLPRDAGDWSSIESDQGSE